MSKRILAAFVLVLACVLAFTLAACNDGTPAGEQHKHTLEKVDGVPATCTEDGIAEHWTCSGCHKNFSDAEGATELDETVISALGHDYVDGVCTRCGTEDENAKIGPLTRAEFRKALDLASLPNFTVTDKNSDGTINYLYKFASTAEYDIAYYSEPSEGYTLYLIQKKGEEVATQYVYNAETSEWDSETVENTVADLKANFISSASSNLSFDPVGAYPTATFDGEKYILPDAYKYLGYAYDVEVAFDGEKRLASLRIVIRDGSTPYIFSDYGTTEVVLPDFDAKVTLGFEFGHSTSFGMTASLSVYSVGDLPAEIYAPTHYNGTPIGAIYIIDWNSANVKYISLKGLDQLSYVELYGLHGLEKLELPLITGSTIFSVAVNNRTLTTVTYPGTKAQWTAAGLDKVFSNSDYLNLKVEFGTHVFGDWTTVTEAGCETDGSKTRTCSDCGKVEEAVIPATGHNYGDWEVTAPVTCTEDGKETRTCSACGDTEERVITAKGHTVESWDVTTPATCVNDGEKTGYCTVCGKPQTQVIPATGVHDYSSDWKTDADKHWHECSMCGGHKDEGTHTLTDGNECSVCGYAKMEFTLNNNTYTLSKVNFTAAEIVIPDTYKDLPVTRIGDGVFEGCTELTSVTIPASVTSIGEKAFYGCTSLADVTLPQSSTRVVLGDRAFAKTAITQVTLNSVELGESVFAGCTSLNTVYIHTLYWIRSWTFSGCTSLTNVTIENGLIGIAEDAFVLCDSLEEITFTGTKEDWMGIQVQGNWAGYNMTIHCSDGDITEKISGHNPK